jgi:hypothetical protein
VTGAAAHRAPGRHGDRQGRARDYTQACGTGTVTPIIMMHPPRDCAGGATAAILAVTNLNSDRPTVTPSHWRPGDRTRSVVRQRKKFRVWNQGRSSSLLQPSVSRRHPSRSRLFPSSIVQLEGCEPEDSKRLTILPPARACIREDGTEQPERLLGRHERVIRHHDRIIGYETFVITLMPQQISLLSIITNNDKLLHLFHLYPLYTILYQL